MRVLTIQAAMHAQRTQVRLPAVLPPVRHRAAAQPAGHLMELATVLVRPGTRARRGLRLVRLPPGRNARQPDVPSPQPCAHTCTQVARPAASAAAGRLVDGAALLLARLAAGRQPARTARPLRLRDGREHRRQHPSRRVRKQVSHSTPPPPARASRHRPVAAQGCLPGLGAGVNTRPCCASRHAPRMPPGRPCGPCAPRAVLSRAAPCGLQV